MKQPILIYILGPPATGKSTLAKKLSIELDLPLISKDELKLILFDEFGWVDREVSMRAGRASYDIIDYIVAEQLRVGNSLIVESVPPKFEVDNFKKWQREHNSRYIQIYCEADANVIRSRFKARIFADRRHVSIVEGEAGLQNLENLISEGFTPIDVKSEIIKIDTTDFSKVNITELVSKLRRILLS